MRGLTCINSGRRNPDRDNTAYKNVCQKLNHSSSQDSARSLGSADDNLNRNGKYIKQACSNWMDKRTVVFSNKDRKLLYMNKITSSFV